MASHHFLLLSLLSLLLAFTFTATAIRTTTITTTTFAPTPSPISPLSVFSSPAPQPQQPTSTPQQEAHVNTIIDAIIGAGDFSNWANILAEADPATIPLSATIFIADDNAFLTGFHPPDPPVNNFVDPLVFPYHIVPGRFSFSELQDLSTGARLPTILPGNSLLITNNSASNFTISGAKLTRPDIFDNAVVSVHGVGRVLDYTLFGNDENASESNRTSPLLDSDRRRHPRHKREPIVYEVSAGTRRSRPRYRFWLWLRVLVLIVLIVCGVHLGHVVLLNILFYSNLKKTKPSKTEWSINRSRIEEFQNRNKNVANSNLKIKKPKVPVAKKYARARGRG